MNNNNNNKIKIPIYFVFSKDRISPKIFPKRKEIVRQ